jgi:hypothetical protein
VDLPKTLDELKAMLPAAMKDQFGPLIDQYGPKILAMTQAELWAWINLLLAGDKNAAYKALLAKGTNDDLLGAWGSHNDEWIVANTTNAANKAFWEHVRDAALAAAGEMALIALGF